MAHDTGQLVSDVSSVSGLRYNIFRKHNCGVGRIGIPRVDLLRQPEKRSVLSERRVVPSDVDGGVFNAICRLPRRENDTAAGEGEFQLLDDRRDDRLFLTHQFAGCLERGHVKRPNRHRAVVSHVLCAVEVEKDDLALELIQTGIDQMKTRKLWIPSNRQHPSIFKHLAHQPSGTRPTTPRVLPNDPLPTFGLPGEVVRFESHGCVTSINRRDRAGRFLLHALQDQHCVLLPYGTWLSAVPC